jgi:hypothetical protein
LGLKGLVVVVVVVVKEDQLHSQMITGIRVPSIFHFTGVATTPRLHPQPPALGGAPLPVGGRNSGEHTQGAEFPMDSSYIVLNGDYLRVFRSWSFLPTVRSKAPELKPPALVLLRAEEAGIPPYPWPSRGQPARAPGHNI